MIQSNTKIAVCIQIWNTYPHWLLWQDAFYFKLIRKYKIPILLLDCKYFTGSLYNVAERYTHMHKFNKVREFGLWTKNEDQPGGLQWVP